ncbi:hypothetical protein Sbal117_2298 [Shewanella baltica OS117]|nr:hypothetical protein Sbal117_2298 [Shewanella baltica OS117]
MSYESLICTQLQREDDVFLWPDYSWCFRYELIDHSHKSDDYEVVYCLAPKWFEITWS